MPDTEENGKTSHGPYEIGKILACLPHRYPFLLIDRILEIQAKESIRALKNVSANEPYFQGHFPGTPIMPGVLIVEAMGQAGGVLVIDSLSPEREGSLVYFMGFDKVRFRRPVVPGDRLILEVTLLKARPKVVKMSGIASVDGNRVAEAELLAAFGDA